MPTDPSPSWPPPNAPRTSRASTAHHTWTTLPRWQRRSAYVVAALVGLGAVSAATAEQDEDAVVTATATIPAPSTTASTAESTLPSTPAPASTVVPTPPSVIVENTTAVAPAPTAPPFPPPPTTTPATVPESMLALDVLASIPVENEHPDGYDRDRFGYGDTTDAHGCRTRALVLRRDSLTPAQVDAGACTVVAGDWYSRYDGLTWTDPAEVQIDHVVSLKEAWDSGAWAWNDARLTAFGNDVDDARSLVVVTGAANSSKGEKDPSNWIPPNADAVCAYVADWTAIKARWGLAMDQSEHGRIRNLLTDRCPDQTIAPWLTAPGLTTASPPSVATTPAAAEPAPPAPAPVIPPVPPPPIPAGNCEPSYPTLCIPVGSPDLDCGDIGDRRFPVLAPDPHRFDGNDDDGIGCES